MGVSLGMTIPGPRSPQGRDSVGRLESELAPATSRHQTGSVKGAQGGQRLQLMSKGLQCPLLLLDIRQWGT